MLVVVVAAGCAVRSGSAPAPKPPPAAATGRLRRARRLASRAVPPRARCSARPSTAWLTRPCGCRRTCRGRGARSTPAASWEASTPAANWPTSTTARQRARRVPLEALCKRGDRRSCSFFAQCLDGEDAFRHDRAEALRLFRDGCSAGERVACRELGFHVFEGDGVAKDLAGGFALLRAPARWTTSWPARTRGSGGRPGRVRRATCDRAKTLYRTACARGVRQIPCEALRRLGETPPSTVVSSPDATEAIHVSTRFRYEWRVPANWEWWRRVRSRSQTRPPTRRSSRRARATRLSARA